MQAYIFRCNNKTKPEVFERMLFGEELGYLGLVQQIDPEQDLLFLYNTSTYEFSGPYKLTSKGGKDIEKGTWNGRFPVQIRFEEFSEATEILGVGTPPVTIKIPKTTTIPYTLIQHLIKKYRNGIFPYMELSEEQVKKILRILTNSSSKNSID